MALMWACGWTLAMVLGAAGPSQELPGFLGPEVLVPDRDIPISRAPVTPEEIDEVTSGAGWGLMSRSLLHEVITGANGTFVLDRVEGVRLPHATWARPWAGGRVKVLVLANLEAARQVVEIAHRLDGDLSTVLLPPEASYKASAGDRELVQRLILDRLRRVNPEVCLVADYSGALAPVNAEIQDRVQKGMGLVYMLARERRTANPNDTAELPPEQWPALPGLVDLRTGYDQKVPWRAEGPAHFAWSGLAGGGLDPLLVPRVIYPGRGWQVLATVDKHPWLLAREVGRGRLLVLLTSAHLLPAIASQGWRPAQESRQLDDRTSVVLKGLLWAARKDTGVLLDMAAPPAVKWNEPIGVTVSVVESARDVAGTLEVRVQDADYHDVFSTSAAFPCRAGQKSTVRVPALQKNGRYYVDAVLRDGDGRSLNWHSVPVSVEGGLTLHLKTNQEVFKPGQTLLAQVRAEGLAEAFRPCRLVGEVWDAYGRVVARQGRMAAAGTEAAVELKCELPERPGQVLMVVGRAVADGREIAYAEQEISVPAFGLEDYHVIVWPHLVERPSLHLDLLRRLGFDTIVTGPWGPPVDRARAALWSRLALSVENGFHLATCLSDKYWPGGCQEYDTYFERVIRPFARQVLRRYGCRLYSLSNEAAFYKGYGAEKPITAAQEAAFRAYLKQVYGSVEAINRQWETSFQTLEEVKPLPLGTKPKGLNFSRQVDWDLFLVDFSVREQRRAVDESFQLMEGTCPWGSTSGSNTERQAEAGASFHGNTMGDGLKYASGAEPGWYDLWHEGTCGLYAFMGYDWPQANYGFYPWYNLLHGSKTEFHFISGGAAGLEGALTRRGLWTRDFEAPIRAGIGKLLATSRRRNDPVAFLHSDLSGYVVRYFAQTSSDDRHAAQFYGRFAYSSFQSFVQLVLDAQLHPTFLTERDVQAGRLQGMKLLMLSHVPAMTEATAAAVRRFAQQGGLVVADLCPAVFDEHGKLLPQGRLDDFFGLRRERLALAAYPAEYTLGLLEEAPAPYFLPQEWFYVEFRETGIQPTDGRPLGKHIIGEEAPAFIFKRHGSGASLYLNYLDSQYRKNRDPRHLTFMRALLKCAGVQPQALVTDGFVPLAQFDVVRFEDDQARHVAIIRDDVDSRTGPEVVLQVDRDAHAYDVREGQYLGHGRRFQVSVPRWKPKLVSLLPCRINGLDLAVPDRVRRGETLTWRVAAKTDGPATSLVYRLAVLGPDGQEIPAHARKVRTAAGSVAYQGRLSIALNEPLGAWTLEATEVVSGRQARATFTVVPGEE